MEKPRGTFVWGILLVVIGVVFMIGNHSRVGMEKLWPIFPLIAGLTFCAGYFYNRKNVGLLMPGSIFVVIGLLFFYCTFAGWHHMANLWPLFLIAPATGFVAIYFGGMKDKDLLIPAGILTGLGIIFLFITHDLGDYWPILMILAGILLIVLHLFNKRKDQSSE
jgi:hypothetical protein